MDSLKISSKSFTRIAYIHVLTYIVCAIIEPVILGKVFKYLFLLNNFLHNVVFVHDLSRIRLCNL